MKRFIISLLLLFVFVTPSFAVYTSTLTGAQIDGALISSSMPVGLSDLQAIAADTYPDGYVFTTKYRTTDGDGGGGSFRWLSGDQSANAGVLVDTSQGVFVLPLTPGDGSTGCWVRVNYSAANVRYFGAKGDGTTNDQPAFQGAANIAKLFGIPIYVPASASFYLLEGVGVDQVALVDCTHDILIFGDGLASKIKRGAATSTVDFISLFDIRNHASAVINVEIRDLYIDDNATNNPLSGTDVNEFQHNHVFAVQPQSVGGINVVSFSNIYCTDPMADVCNVSGNATLSANKIIADQIVSENRTRTRSDVTVTCSYDTLIISNCDCSAIEVETNSAAEANLGQTFVSNCVTDMLDLSYLSYARPLFLDNVLVKKTLVIEGFNVQAQNSTFQLSGSYRLNSNLIAGVEVDFRNCRFKANSDFVGANGLTYVSGSTTTPKRISFDGCEFDPNGVAPYLFYDINAYLTGKRVYFTNNTFKDGATAQDMLFRSGWFSFVQNSFERTSGLCMAQSTVADFAENYLEFIGNSVQKTGVELWQPAIGGDYTVNIIMRNNWAYDGLGALIAFTRYDKIMAPRGAGLVLNFKQVDTGESDGIPTAGKYVKGHWVRYIAPVAGGYSGAVCTVSGNPGTWKECGAVAP